MLRTTPLALIACIVLATSAQAHTLTTPRMVHVRVSADRVEVAVSWLIHAGPRAQHLRSRFDRDGDGNLSEVEQDGIAAWLQRRVDGALELSLDGLTLHPEVGAMDLSLARHADADDEGLRFGSRSAVLLCPREGSHELTIADRPEQATHSVPLRVDVAWDVVGATAEGEAMPLTQSEPGVLGGGGFTGRGGKIVVRFDVPAPDERPASDPTDAVPPAPGWQASEGPTAAEEDPAPAPAR